MGEHDPEVKEAACWAIGNISKHNGSLAQSCVKEGAVPALVHCLQEPEVTLKQTAASALANICSHSPELAQIVVDENAISHLTPLIESSDTSLKKQVCSCLSHIAKHSTELAELVVESEIFPKIFFLLKDSDKHTRKNAATLIRDIVRHSPELSALFVKAGGVPSIVDFTTEIEGNDKLPGIMTLGFISTFSETLATSVIKQLGIPPLGLALSDLNSSNHVKSAAAWAIGQIGRHSSSHAKAVANANLLPKLMEAFMAKDSDADLKEKSKKALKNIIEKCTYLEALDPLLSEDAPTNILKHIVNQYAKILPTNLEEKKRFVTSKGLATLQKIKVEEGSALKESIDLINALYPPDVVNVCAFFSFIFFHSFLETQFLFPKF